MKQPKSQQRPLDPSSKDAIRHQAAREVINQVERRSAEEEELERDEKPGRLVVRVLAGILLIMWIIAMSWIAIKSIKKRDAAIRMDEFDVKNMC